MARARILCLFVWISARFWIHQPRMAEIAAGEPERPSDRSMRDDFLRIQTDLDRVDRMLGPELSKAHRGDVS